MPSVTCPVLTVTNADFADCNGDYSVTEERVAWAADRPVYAHADKDRYLSILTCTVYTVHLSTVTMTGSSSGMLEVWAGP